VGASSGPAQLCAALVSFLEGRSLLHSPCPEMPGRMGWRTDMARTEGRGCWDGYTRFSSDHAKALFPLPSFPGPRDKMKAGISHLACSSNRKKSLSKPYTSVNLMKLGSPLPRPLLSRPSILCRQLAVSIPRGQVRGEAESKSRGTAGFVHGSSPAV